MKVDKGSNYVLQVIILLMAMFTIFNTILMSAENHRYGHYHKHDRILEDGDFVILDAGPDFSYYNADISTSFPARVKSASSSMSGALR